MTGISGWHSADQAGTRAEATAERMAEKLPRPGSIRHAVGRRGTLACRLPSGSLASDPDAGLHAAIEGAPQWHGQALAAIAGEQGDGAALLAAYRSAGADLTRQVTGPFALAIIDEQADAVVLAVDRMGLRPMCYAVTPSNDLVFGSSAGAVLAHGAAGADLAAQSIYDYVYFHVVPSPASVFGGIRKLEPGQCLQFHNATARLAYYWTPQFATHNDRSDDSLQEELLSTLRAAVADDFREGSTGAFLSGGLDSSTVCGLASELSAKPLAAYSIGFAQEGYDEIEYARIAAAHFGLDLHEYYVTPDDIAAAIPVIASSYDEPFGNSSAVPAFFCAKIAREDGIDRLLAGDGGDELFAGNERYATQQLFRYYEWLPSVARKYVVEPAVFKLPMEWSRFTHKVRRYVEQARIPMPERLQTYNYLHMNDPQDVFAPGFLAGIDMRGPLDDMSAWYERGRDASLVDRMLLFDWKLTLADNDVRKVNRMCDVAGVEVRYPMMNDRLVEFSTRVPASLKLRNRELRYFFKNATAEFLPREIIHKQKHGFGLPFGDWLVTSQRLREIVLPALENLGNRGILRQDFIHGLLEQHANVHAAYYGNIIWVLAMLEHWLAAHGHEVDVGR